MEWNIDPAHTTVGFSARHMGLSKVRGRFDSFRGVIEGDPSDISTVKGNVEIDTASVNTGNPDRDAHLRSADFFDVEKYPTMRFVSKSVSESEDGGYTVVGDLTIKDVTREVEVGYEHAGEGVDPWGNRKLGGTLTATIKRSDWGLTWNAVLESGGFLVSDKVQLEIDLQVVQSAEAAEKETIAA
jgi:polyisoprenoid-binding protein YceI